MTADEHVRNADQGDDSRVGDPEKITELNESLKAKLRKDGLQVKWLGNYAVWSPYDPIDVLEAPDPETVVKLTRLVRSLDHHVTAETGLATPWETFVQMAKSLAA